ncbi:MAG: hypothetical protein WCI05_07205 [Myxococcales bacterium]
MRWYARLGAALLVCSLAGSAPAGCASERDLINRVQPNALRKSDLVGLGSTDAPEWYLRNLVLQVQRTNPFMSDGLQDLTRRVRFEIW